MPRTYSLFTLPECAKCREAKAALLEAKVGFALVDLDDGDGLARFRKLYREIKDRLPRDDEGTMPVPVLVVEEEGRVVDVAHGGAEAMRACLSRA